MQTTRDPRFERPHYAAPRKFLREESRSSSYRSLVIGKFVESPLRVKAHPFFTSSASLGIELHSNDAQVQTIDATLAHVPSMVESKSLGNVQLGSHVQRSELPAMVIPRREQPSALETRPLVLPFIAPDHLKSFVETKTGSLCHYLRSPCFACSSLLRSSVAHSNCSLDTGESSSESVLCFTFELIHPDEDCVITKT